jgi:hypothetical protein
VSPTRRLLTRIDGTAPGLALLNRCTAIRTEEPPASRKRFLELRRVLIDARGRREVRDPIGEARIREVLESVSTHANDCFEVVDLISDGERLARHSQTCRQQISASGLRPDVLRGVHGFVWCDRESDCATGDDGVVERGQSVGAHARPAPVGLRAGKRCGGASSRSICRTPLLAVYPSLPARRASRPRGRRTGSLRAVSMTLDDGGVCAKGS